MKKIISTLAVAAGLAAGLMGGAHAQTFNGYDANNNVLFTADLNKSNVSLNPAYGYNYVVTLDKTFAPNIDLNTFTFNFGQGIPVDYVSSPGFTEASTTPGAFSFGAPMGLTKAGDSATFSFFSPLPPVGTVSTASTSPAIAGGGTTTIGPGVCAPCAAVPEPASLALLGLGALPLAFVARRRMAAK